MTFFKYEKCDIISSRWNVADENDVLLYAYRKSIQPSIEWLIKQIPIIDGKFQYVFVVDKGNLPESVREPNYAMEDFVRRMIKSLGVESVICKELFTVLSEKSMIISMMVIVTLRIL